MHAVIMAGGSGTRFWPASRRDRPKQFLCITGADPMVLETCNRLAPLASDEEITLVMGAEHLPEARTLFEDRSVHLIGEPEWMSLLEGIEKTCCEREYPQGWIQGWMRRKALADRPGIAAGAHHSPEVQAAGISTVNRVPLPGSLSRWIVPWCW